MYNDISRHWTEMPDNMKKICMTQIKKAVTEKFDTAVEAEIPTVVETIPLPEDAEAKMLGEFGDEADLAGLLSQKDVSTATNTCHGTCRPSA
jgi:hypothetical protein